MINKDIKPGAIFSVKVSSEEKIYGRILFNVNDYLDKNRDLANYFDVYRKCILIETFGNVAKDFDESFLRNIAVKSSFIPVDVFSDELEWQLLNNVISVPFEYITFPEVLRFVDGKIYFCVGEVVIPTAFDEVFRDECGVYPSFGSGYWEVVATLDYADRKDLIEDKGDIMERYFKDADLRESPEVRRRIYYALNEDPDMPYDKLALKHVHR